MDIAEKIDAAAVPAGRVAIFYLGQAGFLLKNSDGTTVLIDPYFSDEANRLFGFKRMSPPLSGWEKIAPDYFFATHSHIDHLDTVSLPTFAANQKTVFLGAPDCAEPFRAAGIPPERVTILAEGERHDFGPVSVRAVYADHGELAPEAVGLWIDFGRVKIYHSGDTAYRPEKIRDSLGGEAVDVLIAPINGQFGNLTAKEACGLAAFLKPKTVIACHFWMFLEHVAADGLGDPVTFLTEAKSVCPSVKPMVMAPGEMSLF